MKLQTFVVGLVVVGISITESFASPLPTGETAASNSTNKVDSATNENDETLECIMEIITVMASGTDENMSPQCKALLESLQGDKDSREQETPDESAADKSTADLQSQLQDLTSQLKTPKRAEDTLDLTDDENEDLLDVKRHMASEAHDHDDEDGDQEKKSGIDQNAYDQQANDGESDQIDEPFVTTLNSDNDDFLIIPLKYLQKEMLAYKEEPETTEAVHPQEEENVSFEEALDAENPGDQREMMGVTEESDKGASLADDEIDEDRLDALFRVEMDISRLSEDLNRLKTNKPDSSSGTN